MYILDQRTMPMFTAPDGAPWPRGTAIALEPFPQHSGFIDYTLSGEQIIVHKSKRHGGAVLTSPEQFNENRCAYRIVRIPANEPEADKWLRIAYAAVERGDTWSGFANCQDFLSQAINGRKSSPTRDGILGTVVTAGLLWYFGNN
jgi:hypothetical protein